MKDYRYIKVGDLVQIKTDWAGQADSPDGTLGLILAIDRGCPSPDRTSMASYHVLAEGKKIWCGSRVLSLCEDADDDS